MKKNFYFLFLFTAIIFSSCSKDDDGEQTSSTNTLTVGDTEVSITVALVEDYGINANHYNYDFTMNGVSDNTTYSLYLELLSPTSAGQGFQTGTFNYVNTLTDNNNEFIFVNADVNDIDIVSGQVSVTGANNNYTVKGSFILANDVTVSVDYSGQFTYSDER